MSPESPSAFDLAERPELASLHLLDASLVLAEAALLAVHPELHQADFFPQAPPLDPDAWLADSILIHISAIQTALQRYQSELRRQRALRLVALANF